MDMPIADTARSTQHEPNTDFPVELIVQMAWVVDGKVLFRNFGIGANQFFGHGAYGAPMEGAALMGMIENMRKLGPPAPPAPAGPVRHRSLKKGKRRDKKSR